MLWVSMLLVFGTLALVGASVTAYSSELLPGASQIIHGRVPWPLFAALWGGVGLGVVSLLRGRTLPKLVVVLLEVPIVAGVSWYVLVASALPAHSLALGVGDPFPAYALQDQDGTLHQVAAGEPRPPALYIFYRGHW